MSSDTPAERPFSDLGLSPALLSRLDEIGYEAPSPIQERAIPLLLEGRDLLGQAQTGTGKTAAFALPLLDRLDLADTRPQLLVLTPTRELAIQVAEALQHYAAHLEGFHVLPVYGGSNYADQLRRLRRGVQVVVGTPGRLMDHMERGTLDLGALRALVLDEADEMLRMGFIDDVEWILKRTPAERQTALFSATLPGPVRAIAERHMREPVRVAIEARTRTADTIRQRWLMVAPSQKLEALTRLLEVEPVEAAILFARTKTATVDLAERLAARGYAVAALNGDIPQAQRERTVKQLKAGRIDLLVATDVAARGLDVDRISHVINYDVPHDTESYVHRIGRTGRAGREGQAILFISPRERRMLYAIERATGTRIEPMPLPSTEAVNDRRMARFMQRIDAALAADDLEPFRALVTRYEEERDLPPLEIAAALARLVQGDEPLMVDDLPAPAARQGRGERPARGREGGGRPRRGPDPSVNMERFRIEVGHRHGVRPGNIVGAIANEAGLESRYIGRILIREDHSMVELPEGMPKEVLRDLKRVWVAGRPLNISRLGGAHRERGRRS